MNDLAACDSPFGAINVDGACWHGPATKVFSVQPTCPTRSSISNPASDRGAPLAGLRHVLDTSSTRALTSGRSFTHVAIDSLRSRAYSLFRIFASISLRMNCSFEISLIRGVYRRPRRCERSTFSLSIQCPFLTRPCPSQIVRVRPVRVALNYC